MKSLSDILDGHRVIICVGSGGVGKTTMAAVLALEGARRGRSAVVVTIDPARRLANALGLQRLSDTPTEIPPELWSESSNPAGCLSALMLDAKSTFDRLVTSTAESPEQARHILDNTFYHNVLSALGGTQEYMAAEKLFELNSRDDYDLIVVDTPPTRHALDFLDAPRRLLRLLDNRVFRLLMMPTVTYLRVAGIAVQTFLRTVSRVVGTEVIRDVVAFLRAFEGMEEGFRSRAASVDALLADTDTAFVLITSPRHDTLDEAVFFASALTQHGQSVAALVVNRVHPEFGNSDPSAMRQRALDLRNNEPGDPQADSSERARLAFLYDNLADFRNVVLSERSTLSDLASSIGAGALSYVTHLTHDVHDFDTLTEVSDHLFDRVGKA